MFEENYYEIMSAFIKKSDFGEPRDYGYATFHAGDDYASRRFKRQNVYNLIDGVCLKKGKAEYAGKFVILKHNFKYLGGVDEEFFSCYKHLDSVRSYITKKLFISYGSILGKMGNTGYSKTYEDKKWRLLTKEEKKDPKCNRAVHTHLEFYQKIKEKVFIESELIKEIKKKAICNESLNYFCRKDKLFIHPNLIMNYAKLLLEKNNG